MNEFNNWIEKVSQDMKETLKRGYDEMSGLMQAIEDKIATASAKLAENQQVFLEKSMQELLEKRVEEFVAEYKKQHPAVTEERIIEKTNHIEVEKPVSAYDITKRFRQTMAKIKVSDNQVQIVNEIFSFCQSLTEKLRLFIVKKREFRGFLTFDANGEADEQAFRRLSFGYADSTILNQVFDNKEPYIGKPGATQQEFVDACAFDAGQDISIFPMLLKGQVVVLLVFQGNIWKDMYLIDSLLMAAEMRTELTFTRRKLEPHYTLIPVDDFYREYQE